MKQYLTDAKSFLTYWWNEGGEYQEYNLYAYENDAIHNQVMGRGVRSWAEVPWFIRARVTLACKVVGLLGRFAPTKALLFGWWRFTQLAYLVKRVGCAVKGHAWMDESYGGPESGCMAGSCNRCGYSFHTTLY